MEQYYIYLDYFLIWPYRLLPGLAGFWLGTAVLAIWCVLLGELSMGAIFLWNREHYAEQTNEMVRMHNLSVRAIQAKDKKSYKAANSFANEHFGKAFFAQAALFAVSLWPVPFALAWLAERFGTIDIPVVPGLDWAMGYPFFLILLYIIERILFSRIKGRLPFFGPVAELQRQTGRGKERMIGWGEVNAGPVAASKSDDNVDTPQDSPNAKDATDTKGATDGGGETGKETNPETN
ncbi:MAG: hypothetical protein ACNI3A_15295 [Desulfovibrio sp.]|uniref:hypothetical protein n=1 Tax=Desulfovibrio sp. 7SRBS1 TaxID=3378064 RepID=UPI003B407B39